MPVPSVFASGWDVPTSLSSNRAALLFHEELLDVVPLSLASILRQVMGRHPSWAGKTGSGGMGQA